MASSYTCLNEVVKVGRLRGADGFVSVAILKVMRCLMGSQWSNSSAGVMLWRRLKYGRTRRAREREFWIRWRRSMDEVGRLKKRELQ